MTRHDASTGAAGVLLALALIPAFWPSDAMAQDCTKEATDLIAAKTINVGDINVCNDATTLTVTYKTTFPWCLLATNLHVATSVSGIPQTSKGSPKQDEFAFGDVYDCVGTATSEIPLDEVDGGVGPGDTVFVAAHAQVEDDTGRQEGAWGAGTRFVQRGDWAMYFTYEVQGCGDSGSKCVFVTSSVHQGNFGGLAAGDAICQSRAEADDSLAAPGTYKAWLSDSFASPSTRFTQATVPYKLVDGETVANDFVDLTTCDGPEGDCLLHPIDTTETGNVLSGGLVWVGTSPEGVSSPYDCAGWSDTASFGAVGRPLTFDELPEGGLRHRQSLGVEVVAQESKPWEMRPMKVLSGCFLRPRAPSPRLTIATAFPHKGAGRGTKNRSVVGARGSSPLLGVLDRAGS